MRRLRPILIGLGLIVAAMGLLWVGQGLGYITWPRSSFMIGAQEWVKWGSITAAVGLALVLIGRRLR